MNSETSQASTFERSCRHWSEQGRQEMDSFYHLATLDYQLLATQIDWVQTFVSVKSEVGLPIRLLDVACGSGKFPSALLKHTNLAACQDLRIEYDLLDPSAFSINEAKKQLKSPFEPSAEHNCKVQDYGANDTKHIVWATHALYCVPTSELDAAISRMISTLDTTGLGFIAHAGSGAHYLSFYETYLAGVGRGRGTPYSTAEQILDIFADNHPSTPLVTWTIEYEGKVPQDEQSILEGYLQRCIFDDTLSLNAMQRDAGLSKYLDKCFDTKEKVWRFPQRVWLIFFGPLAERVLDWKS